VFEVLQSGQPNKQVIAFGLAFIVAGLAFKFGAVPFHMWVPDVYQGAPTAATLLIAGAPKIASFGMAMRLLVDGMLGLAVDWQQMLIVLAVCSLLVGNLAAIAQTNLKRMLAYSTIAQMGFILLGLASGVADGAANAYSSAMFYIISYVITTLGSFGLLMVLSRHGFESDNLRDLSGLNKRSPLLAAVMAVFMLSLAGIPPMVGFYAKLAVLQAMVATGSSLMIGLAVFAVVMSLIGAFYYLRVIKVMYFDEPAESDWAPIEAHGDARLMLSLNGASVLVLGLVPGGLMALCTQSIIKALAA
jgi:NADH-quinone oxidoreductase subunit N